MTTWTAASGVLEELVDSAKELLRAERFRDEIAGAASVGFIPVGILTLCGEDEDRDVPTVVELPDPIENFEAGGARHEKVEYHEPEGCVAVDAIDRGESIGHKFDVVHGGLEQGGENPSNMGLVVSDEDARRRRMELRILTHVTLLPDPCGREREPTPMGG